VLGGSLLGICCTLSELRINISRLSEGAHSYDFETEPKNLDLYGRFIAIVFVRASLEKTGRQIRLKADLRATGKFTCDRCLDEFEQSLRTHYEIVYITDQEGISGGAEGEIQTISADTTMLDLGEDVRQFLILSVPQKLLCNDECQGLCPVCGSNRNRVHCECQKNEVDPRWEALKKMSLN